MKLTKVGKMWLNIDAVSVAKDTSYENERSAFVSFVGGDSHYFTNNEASQILEALENHTKKGQGNQ